MSKRRQHWNGLKFWIGFLGFVLLVQVLGDRIARRLFGY